MLKKKIDCIIQARLGSSRLNEKIFLKVNGVTLIEHLLKRVKKIRNLNKIILSTTESVNDDKLVEFSKKKKINYFRGSEKNVLDRIYKTAKKFRSQNILFITSDCPIFDISIANQIIEIFQRNNCDFVNNNHFRSYPDGMDIQIFSKSVLKKSWLNAKTNLEKEHLTLYARKNQKKFKTINIVAPKELYWPKLGLTLDEYKDYVLIKKLIKYFINKKNYFFSCNQAISIIKKKKWYKINSKIKRIGDH